jgi:hypothetical protein
MWKARSLDLGPKIPVSTYQKLKTTKIGSVSKNIEKLAPVHCWQERRMGSC